MSEFSPDSIFEFDKRRGQNEMSLRAYLSVLVAYIVGGLILASIIAMQTYSLEFELWWLLPYFALSIPGIILSAKSDNWLVSSMGYLMVILPTGFIVGPAVAEYQVASVGQVALITAGVSIAIGAMGVVYPGSVAHWGGFLLAALWVLIFGDLATVLMVYAGFTPVALGVWDWLGVLLFSALIFYNMNRAIRMPYTLDNAVDNAVAIYLNILNLFLRLLRASGNKK